MESCRCARRSRRAIKGRSERMAAVSSKIRPSLKRLRNTGGRVPRRMSAPRAPKQPETGARTSCTGRRRRRLVMDFVADEVGTPQGKQAESKQAAVQRPLELRAPARLGEGRGRSAFGHREARCGKDWTHMSRSSTSFPARRLARGQRKVEGWQNIQGRRLKTPRRRRERRAEFPQARQLREYLDLRRGTGR